MNNTIPSASNFLNERYNNGLTSYQDNIRALREYAELHCKAQLQAILENVTTKDDPYSYTGNTGSEYPPDIIVDKDSIINAYNLEEKIK